MKTEYYLQKILNHCLFKKSENLKKLLIFLVHNSNSQDRKDVKELTLAMDVFGEGSGFDPSRNSYIRVAVYKLRKKLTQYYRTDGKDDEIIINIPRGEYNAVFHVNDSRSVSDFQYIQQNGTIIPKSIILYLPPLSSGSSEGENPKQDRRSVFLSSLLSYLATYQYLGISFNKSSSDYALNLCDIEESGNLVFYLTLEDSVSGQVLWDRTLRYRDDYSYGDWVEESGCTTALQIGSTVGVVVRQTVLTDYHKTSLSSRVISDFLKPILTKSSADLDRSIRNFRSYHDIPLYHPALLGGMAHLYSMGYVFDTKKDPDLLPQAYELSRKSLSMVPDQVFALLSMARINFQQGNMEKVIELADRIFATLGSYSLVSIIAAYYRAAASGEWERPMGMLRRMKKMIPEPPSCIHFYLFLYEFQRNNLYQAQIEFYQMPCPDDPGCRLLKIALLMKLGRIEEALSLYYRSLSDDPEFELDHERHLSYLKNENPLLESLDRVFKKVLVLQ